jgi:hypothetical protein
MLTAPDGTPVPMEMENFRLYLGNVGHICIEQNIGGEQETVLVHPLQVPALVEWLRYIVAINYPEITVLPAPEPQPAIKAMVN